MEKHLQGTINCMAQYAPGIFNTGNSAMTRVSVDYGNGKPQNARTILYNAYGNVPWIGQTVWGDHDMFHCGRRAVDGRGSGGQAAGYSADSLR